MPKGWYKLDNVAKMFVATSSRRDPRVFRVSCTLTQPVDPQALQTALGRAAAQFPSFQVTLHQGLFWHYLENTDKLPTVQPEAEPPCTVLYSSSSKSSLLYRVTYWQNRINLEMFHAVTDGTGGLDYLKTIVYWYLKEKYPRQMEGAVPEYDASAAERVQDSFRQFYGNQSGQGPKDPAAYHIRGTKLPYDQLQFFELHLPADQLLALAKSCGVSLTSYLSALLLQAVYAEMPALERGRPIAVSLPVNLRNYYPSATARNFFNNIKVPVALTGRETLAQLAQQVDQDMKQRLAPQAIQAQMDQFEDLERWAGIKVVPLAIKNPAVRFFNWLEKRKSTLTLSNLGRIQVSRPQAQFIQGFSAYCSTDNLFVTVCSYNGEMTLGVTSAYRSTGILKRLARAITAAGIPVTLYATEVES